MNNSVQQWLVNHASLPGMLACGLREPDGKFVCHSAGKSCPAAKMEEILGRFAGLRAVLSKDGLAPRWSTWAFEQGHIRFVERPDGWLLGLVVQANSKAVSDLDPLSQEFLSLEAGN